MQKYCVIQIPVAGTLGPRSSFFVPLHHLQHASHKLLVLPGQALTQARPQICFFFQLLLICRSSSTPTHGREDGMALGARQEYLWGWMMRGQRTSYYSLTNQSLWWGVMWENKILEEVKEYQNWMLRIKDFFLCCYLFFFPSWDRNKWGT